MPLQSNRDLLVAVARRLGPLLGEVVFVGGCTTSLLVTDPAAAAPRATTDVDAIVEIASYSEYMRFSKRLRGLGFTEDQTEGAPMCRWAVENMKLDLMPLDKEILGFSNRWYEPTLRNAETRLVEDVSLRIATAIYFIGTKFEAFKGRGNADYYASKDLEDIIAVVDGRPELVEEVRDSELELRAYIRTEISTLLDCDEFLDALPSHVLGTAFGQARVPTILRRLRAVRQL